MFPMDTERPAFRAADRRPATPAEAKALASPLRLRILRLCLDQALTNKQLAERSRSRTGRHGATMDRSLRAIFKQRARL